MVTFHDSLPLSGTTGDIVVLNSFTSPELYVWDGVRWVFIVAAGYQLDISSINRTLQTLTPRVEAIENTNAQSNEVTSGHVVPINTLPLQADVEISLNNPAIKIFNATDSNVSFVSISNGEVQAGGVNAGESIYYHHTNTGDVIINFTILDESVRTSRPNQSIIVESAGG